MKIGLFDIYNDFRFKYNILLILGACGGIAVIVFAVFGNSDGWMPDHANNYLGMYYFFMGAI